MTASAAHRIVPSIRQCRLRARTSLSRKRVGTEPHTATLRTARSPSAALLLTKSILQASGYAAIFTQDGLGLTARKHRYSIVGSLIFHLSFIMVTLGVLLTLATRFHGVAVVAEGETFSGAKKDYLFVSTPDDTDHPLPEIRFKVEDVDVHYMVDSNDGNEGNGNESNGNGNVAEAACRILDLETGQRATIRVNHPYRYPGGETMRLADFGLALLWKVRNAAGDLLDAAFVKLVVYPPGREDHFIIPGLPYKVFVRYFPGNKLSHGRYDTGNEEWGMSPNKPSLFLRVVGSDSRTYHDGPIRPNDAIRLGDNTLTIPELRRWARLEIDSDSGTWLVLLSLVISVLGLAWRLLLYRREISATAWEEDAGTVVLVGGHTEYYETLFAEEFDATIGRIASELNSGARAAAGEHEYEQR